MKRWLARRLGWGNTQGLPIFLQALLFGFTFSTHDRQLWLPVFILAALINLWAWIAALSWRRAIVDTPTSRVASAAQGFVELIGVGRPLPNAPLLTPFTQLPCLWYRFSVERRKNGEWQHAEQGESELPFILNDGSGVCEIDPVGAQIHTMHKEVRTQGDERHTEYVLLKGDRLYAMGDFISVNGEQIRLDRRLDLGDLLADWKSDQDDLHRRFDQDKNGVIDEAEWQQARQAAEREVEQKHREIRNQPSLHRLRKPAARKPYLIANHPPEKLGQRYAWFSAGYLALLLGCLVGIAWAVNLAA
jgi:hypothetical protein